MKRTLWLVIVLIVVAGLLYVLYSSLAGGAAPIAVSTVTVDSGPIKSYVRATGTVASPSDVHVGATAQGRASEVLVEVGNTVTKGQPLARLSNQEAVQQLQIDELEVTKTNTSIEQQRHAIEILGKDYAVGAEPLDKLNKAQEALVMDEVQHRQALAKTALARLRIDQSVVRSPIDGIVINAHIRPGQVVGFGDPLFTLTDPVQQQILAHIEPDDVPDIKIGMPVRVSLENASEQAVDEKVLRIEPAIRKEGQASYLPVWVSLTHSDLAVRPNQQLDVRLLANARTAQRRLPLEALVSTSNRSTVWIVQPDGRLHAQPVTLGMIGDGYAEVLSGLQPGQAVVLPSGQTLKEGDKVRVASTQSKP
jgi:RND family efflux transporter MFP subunit